MSCIWDILFNIYLVSKSLAAKPQNFVDISGAQKTTWGKFGDFDFFYLKKKGYRYYQSKNQLGVTSSPCTI